ncbi:sel1 repeat family protein [Acetobacter musti]|uniref:Sel1 repeat family protein n=1 Tax=Acetobacter musti TaxID=864732 RepID=A0ABX0JMC5_9PROT|nr:tetratricopeptide repeat protein [Acetobacter musti]NHN83253.1 sel1 repeat family protein [Acetobacter musti]
MFSVLRRSSRSPAVRGPLPEHIEAIRLGALKGDPLAQVQWGQALLDSDYMDSDPKAAMGWFSIAAAAGFGPAENMLGRCHHFGRGCPKDLARAAVHYGRAAALGDEWGRYNLGILTLRGLGMPADRSRAFALFSEAARNGHAKSMNILARFLEEGWETERDPEAALGWYRRSAEGGDYRGQHNYATALAEAGLVAEALDWWRRAVVEATSDILLAMERSLMRLGTGGDAGLLARVRERLAEMGIAAQGK